MSILEIFNEISTKGWIPAVADNRMKHLLLSHLWMHGFCNCNFFVLIATIAAFFVFFFFLPFHPCWIVLVAIHLLWLQTAGVAFSLQTLPFLLLFFFSLRLSDDTNHYSYYSISASVKKKKILFSSNWNTLSSHLLWQKIVNLKIN